MLSDGNTPLAFGTSSAAVCQTRSEAAQDASRLIPGLVDFELPDNDVFYFATASSAINGFRLAAFVATKSRLTVHGQTESALILPLEGELKINGDGKKFQARAGQSAFLVPAGLPNQIEASDRSLVRLRIDAARFQLTIRAMLGDFDGPLNSDQLGYPQEVSLNYSDLSFVTIFQHLFAQIDGYGKRQALLDRSGLDDALYRALAMAINPKVFARDHLPLPRVSNVKRLSKAVDYIMSHLDQPITLTQLEIISNLSRRSLHNAFTIAFGMSPMAWVLEQRLLEARVRLQTHDRYASVTATLYSCGFTNASSFSAHYRKRFGETASETMRRS